MGRSTPSYTKLLEEVLREVSELGEVIGEDDKRILDKLIKRAREMQGPIYLTSLPDIRFLVILTGLIDVYKRLERLEKWISKDGYLK